MTQKFAKSRKRKSNHPEQSGNFEEVATKKPKVNGTSGANSIIVEQLVSNDSSTALAALACLASSDEDKLEEFFAGGGNANNLLHFLDAAEEKVKANDVAAVFNAVEAVITHVVRGEDVDRGGVSETVVKRILTDYDKEIVLLISGTNTAYQAKSVLRMLTSFVMLGSNQAREVLMKLNWGHDNWDTLYKRTSKKETPDVRTCFIHFLLSFLMDPSSTVIKDYLGQKTRLINIFSGMMHDSHDIVIMVLDTLKTKILENANVNKTLKMRLFGSNTVKQILSLLKWTGVKNNDQDLIDEEAKETVKECVLSFIKILFGNKKNGVIFPDPTVGQMENVNPLVREVINSMTSSKPWEDVSLSSILVDIVTVCPDQLQSVIGMLESSWEVRDSTTWHQIIDLIISIMERVDFFTMADNVSNNENIVEKVVANVILSSKLVNKVIAPGLKMTEAMTVWCKCCHLLAQLITNLDNFYSKIQQTKPSLANVTVNTARKSLKNIVDVPMLWSLVQPLMSEEGCVTVLNIINIVKFSAKLFGVSQFANLNISEVLQLVNSVQNQAVSMKVRLRILELINLMTIKSERTSFTQSLRLICTEETFELLLNLVVSPDEDQQKSAAETISGLLKSANICLKTEMDVDLLLALVDKSSVSLAAKVLFNAIERRKELQERIQELKFQEVWELKKIKEINIDEMFEEFMEENTSEEGKLEHLRFSHAEYFSPLILSFLESESSFTNEFIGSLVFLYNDIETLLQLMVVASEKVNNKSVVEVLKLISGKQCKKLETDVKILRSNKITIKSKLSEMLYYTNFDTCHEMEELLDNTASEILPEILRHAVNTIANKKADLCKENEANECIKKVLKAAKRFNINVSSISDSFGIEVAELLKLEDENTLSSSGHIEELFRLIPLSKETCITVLNKILQVPVQKLTSINGPVSILVGACHSLAEGHHQIEDSLFVKLLCIVEVLIVPNSSSIDPIIKSLTIYIESSPRLSSQVGSNLITVLLRNTTPSNLELLETLIKADRKHFDIIKSWICQEKQLFSHQIWPLVKLIVQDKVDHVEKKFITIVLRHVVHQVESGQSTPELLEMIRLLSCQARNSRSEKQIELWQRGVKEKKEAKECIETDSESCTQVKTEVLATLQDISGGMDTRLMRECFLPLMHHISKNIKTSPENVPGLCDTLTMCRDKIENKVFLKEFQKSSTTIWPSFYRNVLKYSLKTSSVTAAVSSLKIFSDICLFLMNGDKLSDAETIVDMITNHSNYTSIVSGPSSETKTALINLLLSLTPISCSEDHIPLLLSSYTGTLHPSDRAILTLLNRYETLAGLDLSPYQPLVWGPPAAPHYSVSNSNGWKQIKCSEILGMLDTNLMRRTCEKFPIMLPLDVECEISDDDIEDESIYDPRFLLPMLSYLLSSEVYIDKHIKFLEVGAVGLALCSLASKDRDVRRAGYHVVAKVNSALETAKLSQEKQIWTHMISLLRLGVVTSSLTKAGRVSSIITQYLSRCVDVLLNPVSPMYKTVSKSVLAKPMLELGTIPEFQRLVVGDKTEFRWMMESVRAGLRDSRDYSLCVRSNMSKLICSSVDSVVLDRVGHLLVLDIILASVATNYGCVDLVTRHGLLTWCLAIIDKEKVDKAYVRKIISITQQVVDTAGKIDQNKQISNDENGEEMKDNRRLLLQTIEVPLRTILSRLKYFGENRHEPEMMSDILKIEAAYHSKTQ